MDEKLTPYAGFLENFAQHLVEFQPEKICVCAILPSGDILTAYYGDTTPNDKAVMAHNINSDALLDCVVANAKLIVQAADEAEDDE